MFSVYLTLLFCFVAAEGNAQLLTPGMAWEENDPVSSGAELIEKGQFQKAIRLLESALSTFPDHPEIHFWLGIAYFKAGNYSFAERAFTRVTLLDPEDFKGFYNLGAVYFNQEKWAQAAEAFLTASELNPRQKASLYLNAGLSYYKQGRQEEAVLWFNRSLEADPSPSTERNARAMLALISPGKASDGKPNRTLVASLGREYDTNVLLTPADQEFTSRTEDWATLGNLNFGYRFPVTDGLQFNTDLKIFLRRYDTHHDVNYHQYEAQAGLEAPKIIFSPKLSYAFIYTFFGDRPFLSFHNVSFRSDFYRTGKHSFSFLGSWYLGNDLESEYAYLSGSKWTVGVSELSYIMKSRGYIRPMLSYSQVDSKDAVQDPRFSCRFCSYSYRSIEPSIQYLIPLFEKFKSKGVFQYQHRIYRDEDVWLTAPSSTGKKRRKDHRLTFSVSILRSLLKSLEAELKYWGQVNHSNLGDDPQDYYDRDYTKHVFTVNLNLKL